MTKVREKEGYHRSLKAQPGIRSNGDHPPEQEAICNEDTKLLQGTKIKVESHENPQAYDVIKQKLPKQSHQGKPKRLIIHPKA